MRIKDAATLWLSNSNTPNEEVVDDELEVEEQPEEVVVAEEVVDDEIELEEQPKEEVVVEEKATNNLIFVETKSLTGKIWHYFLNGFYKFNRRIVKKNGRACFH